VSDQDLRESVVRQFRAAADSYQISQIGPGDARAIADLLETPQPMADREALVKVINDVAVATGLAKYFKSGGVEDPSDLEEFVAAVMELIRPMPTHKQIVEALAKSGYVTAGHTYQIKAQAGDIAQTVLALINGTAK
jgi:hypothetical protein